MLVRLQCPSCGKSLVVDCDATNQMLLCRACGTSFDAPPDCLLPSANSVYSGASALAQAKRRRLRYALPIGAVSGVALLMIGGLLAAIWPRHAGAPAHDADASVVPATQPSRTVAASEPSLADQVLAMKTDADVLAFSGNFTGAAEKYRQTHALLAGRDASDPLLKELTRQVDEGEHRLNASSCRLLTR